MHATFKKVAAARLESAPSAMSLPAWNHATSSSSLGDAAQRDVQPVMLSSPPAHCAVPRPAGRTCCCMDPAKSGKLAFVQP
jgi:hypothetical protein